MDYTQEQLDALIKEKVTEATTGLFSEEELNRRVTAEVDRRVESGIQKGIETQKTKWEEEYKKKQNMTAEELANEKLREQMDAITSREGDIKKRANMLDAKDMLTEAQIPKTYYDKFLPVLVSDNEETTKTNVQNFIEMYTATKTDIETKVKTELSKVPPPQTGKENLTVTKESFDKMSYSEKLAFKISNPELYKQFMK